jgi:hypothetical protein
MILPFLPGLFTHRREYLSIGVTRCSGRSEGRGLVVVILAQWDRGHAASRIRPSENLSTRTLVNKGKMEGRGILAPALK